MQTHENRTDPFDRWIYLAEPHASIRLGFRRSLRCRTCLRLAPRREILSHSARFSCRKQNYCEHVGRAISSGRPWPVTPPTLTRWSALQRWRCSALRMPQHWMQPKARLRLALSRRQHRRSLAKQRTLRSRLPPLTPDPVVHYTPLASRAGPLAAVAVISAFLPTTDIPSHRGMCRDGPRFRHLAPRHNWRVSAFETSHSAKSLHQHSTRVVTND